MEKESPVILFIKGQSQYNVLRISIDNIADAFSKKGYDVIIYDLLECSSNKEILFRLEEILKNNSISMIFTFNLVMLEEISKNEDIRKFSERIPMVTFLVDHPLYHYERLMAVKDMNVFLFTFDEENVAFIKRCYEWIRYVGFLHIPGFTADNIPLFEQKKTDIIFSGTYSTPQELSKVLADSLEEFTDLVEAVKNIILNDPALSIENAFDIFLKQHDMEVTDADRRLYMLIFGQLDTYIRGYFRDKLIRTLLKGGIKLTVFGNGWEKFEGEFSENLSILGNGDLMEGVSHMADSKIVIGMIPWFKNGIQDRIITTMLNHSVCITDRTPYLEKNFRENEEIVFYDINNMDELPSKIKGLLKNQEKMKSIAESGHKKINERYGMDYFVDSVIEHVISTVY